MRYYGNYHGNTKMTPVDYMLWRHGKTRTYLEDTLFMEKSSIADKIHREDGFRVSEIKLIADTLKLNNDELAYVFFGRNNDEKEFTTNFCNTKGNRQDV